MNIKKNKLKQLFKISLFSLIIVAIYGTMMRYKIAFDFRFFEQKNLLHAHSHFAFSGWISHLLYCGLTFILYRFLPDIKEKKYYWIIIANLLCSVGMLLAFTMQGYGAVSITLSTLTIIFSIIFTVFFIKDAKHFPPYHPSKPWAIMALLLNLFSSLGPFTLAYILATKNFQHELYLSAVYYYLHFQYSGWFFFGAMAIAAAYLPEGAFSLNKYFKVFAITAFLTFFLSVLWIKLPLWLYVITVIAALLQLVAWLFLLIRIKTVLEPIQVQYPKWVNWFFYSAVFALTIKFVLQAVSVIPSLSQLVFGIRPMVIAYLHLVLLGIYSLFLIGYLFAEGFIKTSKSTKIFAFAFLAGVFVNELLLAMQGFAAFSYIPIPYINEMLFGAAVLLLSSAVGMLFSQLKIDKRVF